MRRRGLEIRTRVPPELIPLVTELADWLGLGAGDVVLLVFRLALHEFLPDETAERTRAWIRERLKQRRGKRHAQEAREKRAEEIRQERQDGLRGFLLAQMGGRGVR